MSEELHSEAVRHLIRPDGQEDLCFALWNPSRGRTRDSALLSRLILPQEGDRSVHGNASFHAQYFERALGEAAAVGAGLAFMHCHHAPGWQAMSTDDIRAEEGHAPAAFGATQLPLVGLTLGNDGAWSARFWNRVGDRFYRKFWCMNVRVVGQSLGVTYADHLLRPPLPRVELQRTISSWGTRTQANLSRLRIGIVGLGSVGSIVAETLARTGITRLALIDFDTVEFVNLDRVLHATAEDAQLRRSKVSVLARELKFSATADKFRAEALEWSVCEDEGFREALDCDVLFSCVDRPWPRAVLNFTAFAHLIPVVDGGIRVEVKKDGSLKRADWRAHIAAPGRRCLECLGQFDSADVSTERDGYLDDPKYISGLPEGHFIHHNQNVFAFSLNLASLEALQMIQMVVSPMGFPNPGTQMYHMVPGIMDAPSFEHCLPECPYPALIAEGDHSPLKVTGAHRRAEIVRSARITVSNPARRSRWSENSAVQFLRRIFKADGN